MGERLANVKLENARAREAVLRNFGRIKMMMAHPFPHSEGLDPIAMELVVALLEALEEDDLNILKRGQRKVRRRIRRLLH
jgi:hypothetical protein